MATRNLAPVGIYPHRRTKLTNSKAIQKCGKLRIEMSIIYKNRDWYLIDHREYVSNVYKNVCVNETGTVSYTILAKLFSIVNNKNENNRKRTHNSDNFHEETTTLKRIHERLIQELPSQTKDKFITKYKLLDTPHVRDLAKQLFESTIFNLDGLSGGNTSENSLKCRVKDNYFLMPPHSRFYCGNINEQCQKLGGSKFDIVIADPPWWNKYIRRLKNANDKLSYSMMYNEEIASIPVKGLLSENCLVAVWCTNAPSNIAAVKDLIFPKWGVEYVATWYWLKLTVDLRPICAFGSGSKKQPYERVILGKVGDVKDVPDCQMIASVPSALHSHKPPLLDILSPFVKTENPEILELFARYLLPNTTSMGFEPLKWQHISLYEEIT